MWNLPAAGSENEVDMPYGIQPIQQQHMHRSAVRRALYNAVVLRMLQIKYSTNVIDFFPDFKILFRKTLLEAIRTTVCLTWLHHKTFCCSLLSPVVCRKPDDPFYFVLWRNKKAHPTNQMSL